MDGFTPEKPKLDPRVERLLLLILAARRAKGGTAGFPGITRVMSRPAPDPADPGFDTAYSL